MSIKTINMTLPTRTALALIRAYRFVASPWLGSTCRFWPTCSDYAMQAIEAHGVLRGGWMILARLARCHPYAAGGVDPVPHQFRWRCWCNVEHTRSIPSLSHPDDGPARNPTIG